MSTAPTTLRAPRTGVATGSYSYPVVGATSIHDRYWSNAPEGFYRFEEMVRVAPADAEWSSVFAKVMSSVKTHTSFMVNGPRRLVDVMNEPDRCGLAYGTLEGHPYSGEEAFILHRDAAGIWLTLRSLTRPAQGFWRAAFPFLHLGQRIHRHRYLHSFELR